MRFPMVLGAAAMAVVAACSKDSPTSVKTTYSATLNGANEKPNPVTTTGAGTAIFTLDGNNLSYTINLTSALTGPAAAAHIHVGSSTVAGPVVKGFTINAVATGIVATGTIDLTLPVSATVSGDSLKVLFNNGNAYVNVHTAANPGGEIRGQVAKQ